MLSDLDTRVSEALDEYKTYVKSGEQNFEVDDRDAAIQRILEEYGDKEIERIDGVTVHVDDNTWFNVRKSNSEPLVRLNAEGTDKEIVDIIVSEAEQIIRDD